MYSVSNGFHFGGISNEFSAKCSRSSDYSYKAKRIWMLTMKCNLWVQQISQGPQKYLRVADRNDLQLLIVVLFWISSGKFTVAIVVHIT